MEASVAMQKAQKRLQSICQKYDNFNKKDYENLDINKKIYKISFKLPKKIMAFVVGVFLVVTQTNVMNSSHVSIFLARFWFCCCQIGFFCFSWHLWLSTNFARDVGTRKNNNNVRKKKL